MPAFPSPYSTQPIGAAPYVAPLQPTGIVRAVWLIMIAHGETMTLSRTSEATTIAVQGKRIPGALEQLGNTSAQQRFRVKVAVTEIEAAGWAIKKPARNDTILIGGVTRMVDDVRPLMDSNSVALYELEVVG